MKVYSAIAKALKDNNCSLLFGIMGDSNMQYISEFIEGGGEFVYTISEGAAVAMADGYARVQHRPGFVSVTNGPGITNSTTALIEAHRAGSSVVLLTGTTVSERGKLQDLDVRAAATMCGVEYRTALTADHVVDELSRASSFAHLARRPVLLDIENDFLLKDVEYDKSHFAGAATQRIQPDVDAVDSALGVIASCRRPLVLAGKGAVASDAIPALIALSDLIEAPLATTLCARDSFAGSEYNLGIMGGLSHEVALTAIQEADCIVAFGASLNRYTTAEGSLLKGKAVIQCDINPANLARYYPVTVPIVGDAQAVAETFLEMLRTIELRPWSPRTDVLRDRLAEYVPAESFVDRSSARGLDMRTAIIKLDEVLPRDRAVVTDCGRFDFATWRFLRVLDPSAFIHTVHFGSMGLSIPTGVGAALANPKRPTVVVCGDAGGLVGLSEIATAARYKLPLVVVVMNDGSWGSEYTKLATFGINPEHALLSWPSFTEVARALGAEAVEVRSLDDFDALPGLVARANGPLLVDVRCDPAINPDEYP